MRICVDLDDTLTVKCGLDYTIDSLGDEEMIELINKLHDQGHTIIIHTARKMLSSDNNIGLATARAGYNTFKWLEKYNVKYDEIIFGKVVFDVIIDDKAFGYQRPQVINYLQGLLHE